jgi:alpha-D-ribose 1-methylphosphonate 5-triphosphate diphosphatase
MRCEVCDANVIEMFLPRSNDTLLRLVSLTDHTPGQRQFRDLDQYRLYNREKKWTDSEFEKVIEERTELQSKYAEKHRKTIVSISREKNVPIASHDDTTADHIIEAVEDGVTVSEFPTTLTAARKARELGISIIMGAPNIVRGNSHSGNASARDMAAEGLLDGLSSDYYPGSLLHAPFVLHFKFGMALPSAVAKVTSNVASLIGLDDRGRIIPGSRADLVRVRVCEDLPVVVSTWREGVRIN